MERWLNSCLCFAIMKTQVRIPGQTWSNQSVLQTPVILAPRIQMTSSIPHTHTHADMHTYTHRLRTLAALMEKLSSFPSIHFRQLRNAWNSGSREFDTSSGLWEHSLSHTYTHPLTPIDRNKKLNPKKVKVKGENPKPQPMTRSWDHGDTTYCFSCFWSLDFCLQY